MRREGDGAAGGGVPTMANFCSIDSEDGADDREAARRWAARLAATVCLDHRQPASFADVLGALLSHYRGPWPLPPGARARAWPCVRRLAALSGWSERTVKRALAFARARLALREVTGDERRRGPGPDRYPRRRGVRPVNCYDLSALLARIPVPEGSPASPPAPSAPGPNPDQSDDDDLFPDPFAEAGEEGEAAEARTAAQSVAAMVAGFRAADPSPCSPLSVDTQKNPRTGEASRHAAAPPARRGEVPGDPSGPHKAAGRAPSPGTGAGAARLRALGVSPAMAARIAEDRGDAWATTLAAYVRRAAAQTPLANPAGYAVGVYRQWQAGAGSWPDDFAAVAEREAARARRTVHAPTPEASHAPAPHPVHVAPPPAADRETSLRRIAEIRSWLKKG